MHTIQFKLFSIFVTVVTLRRYVTSLQASRKRLPEGKVPLLVVIIDSINKTLPDATVTLRDITGNEKHSILETV